MTELEDKVVVVTGGAAGIGLGIARALGQAGCRVAILDRDETALDAATVELRALGVTVHPSLADVSDETVVQAAVAATRTALGPVAILVNNAGVAGNLAPLSAIDRVELDRLMSIHVGGAFAATRACVDDMIAAGWGRIVNIASNRGMVGFERSSHYCAAKAALIGATKAWAKEFGRRGVLVNAIAPGAVRSSMTVHGDDDAELLEEVSLTLVQRYALPAEIGALAVFLVSDAGSYFTGQVLSPNGGDTIVGI